MLQRPVNEGFSGGEKKRNEIFQMAVLEPTLAILDETDSGLDIDALRIVAEGVNALRSPERVVHRRHALPAAAQLHRARLRARAERRPHRRARAAASWRSSSRRRATAGSRPQRRSAGDRVPCRAQNATRRARDSRGPRRGDAGVAARRCGAGASAFAAVGFPTTRQEDWRFTNVAPIAEAPFAPRGEACRAAPRRSSRSVAMPDALRLVIRQRPLRGRRCPT